LKSINYHFIASGIASLSAVALATFASLPLPLAATLELLPLTWYFSRLLREARQDGALGQSAIDSIYYFGFLITIFSLAASVFRVWLHGIGQDIGALIAHFGVGLLATGLALAFRMWLTALTEQLGKKDLDETIETYIRRIDDIVAKVEMSAASFEGLSRSLQERTESVVGGAVSAFETTTREMTQTFRDNLELITRDATGAIQLFSTTVKEVSMADHVVTFDRNLGTLTAGLHSFANEMKVFGRKLAEDAHKSTMLALDKTIAAHGDGLAKLTARSTEAMNDILDGIEEIDFADDAAIVREQMQALSTTVNNITKKFGMLEIKIEQAAVTQSAETARLVVEGFARDFKGISAMVENEALERVQSILKNIAAETEKTMSAAAKTGSAEMIERMNGVAEAIAQVSEDIRRAKVGEQVTSLADAAGVAQTALSDSASEFRAVVAEMKKLEGRILAIDSAADGGPVLAAPRTTEYAK
jgi:hypothetical protein